MQRHFSFPVIVAAVFLLGTSFFAVSTVSGSPASSYSLALRRYPYLTDLASSYATINWATDRSESSGGVRFGKVVSESCTAHYVAATNTAITVNGVLQYQWNAQLNLEPGIEYCYRVYLGTSPAGEIDLLGSDPSPSFWTQVPPGGNQPFSFVVLGDWGWVDGSGANSYQADLMSLIASSGSHFAVTTGDNGYPSGSQTNFGDLIQTGADLSTIFGPSFWKVPGDSLAIFPTVGNHGFYSSSSSHPFLTTWPQDRVTSTSGGRYVLETYCCLNSSISRMYPSAWYAFDAGPARFYMLTAAWQESNVGTASEYEMDYDYHWAPGTDQYEWLAADLAAHPSVLKFAFFHYPIYSDNPNEPSNTFFHGSAALEGLLKANGVDIAFTGHAHIYERNFASADGIINYVTGGGGAPLGTLGTCTFLDAYAIKFTSTGKACGSAPMPTGPAQVYHFIKVTVNGTSVTVTPINSLGQSFDVRNFDFTDGAETIPPSTPTNLTLTTVSGTQIDLSWSASTDNTGVRGYGIFRNGELVNVVDKNTMSYSDANLVPATGYIYQIDAFDGSGNHSARSSSRSAMTPVTAAYTFTPVADSYVAADTTNTNYGRSATLKTDASPATHSYLRFNVEGLVGTVTQATLRLYTSSSTATGYDVRRVVGQTWEEGTLTFTSAPAVGSVLGSSGNFSSGNWTSVDVTALITGDGLYDLALTTTTTTGLNFRSRESATSQPQLVIETSTSGGGTATLPPTPTATAGSGNILTFLTVADARVVEASPATNYGTSTTLQVDGDTRQRSYIRFALSGISAPPQDAKMRVFCTTNGTNNGPAAYLADSSWIESGSGGVTWNAQPALLSGVVDNKGAIGTSSWVEYDVTALVAGNGIYTFALIADGSDGVTFSAREGSAAPELVVTFGTGTPTASSTTTMSPTFTSTASPTLTMSPTRTATNPPTVTDTVTFTPSSSPAATDTSTGTPIATSPTGPTDTPTFTSTPTDPPSETDTPTLTPTLTATPTDLPPATDTPTVTITPSPTRTMSPTPTATAGPAAILTFITEADTRVSQSSPATNYGSQANLLISASDGAVQTGYVRFTVSGINGSVQNVKLRVFCTSNGTNNGPAAYLAENDWIEKGTGGVTWNTRPAQLSGAFDNKGAVPTNTWVEYDITALVSGDGTYTFALVADGDDGLTFSSREGTAAPQLVVTFDS